MKKDVYIMTGVMALLVVAFIVGYNLYSKKNVPSPTAINGSAENSSEFSIDSKTLFGEARPTQGPLMAKLSVVEFFDPECGACKAFHPRLKKILGAYEGNLKYVARFMPYHHNSIPAMKALEAASEQGKYWEFLEYLFSKQDEWGEKKDDQSEAILKYAKDFGFDMKKFKATFNSEATTARILKDKSDGESMGVTGTPSFFVNGKLLAELGEMPLKAAIDAELKK